MIRLIDDGSDAAKIAQDLIQERMGADVQRHPITIDEATTAIRAAYYTAVRSIAEDILAQVKAGDILDEEELQEYLWQTVEGSEWVIYTHKALLVMVASDNWDSVDDDGPNGPNGVADLVSFRTFWALREDVREMLSDIKWPEDEDEDEADALQ